MGGDDLGQRAAAPGLCRLLRLLHLGAGPKLFFVRCRAPPAPAPASGRRTKRQRRRPQGEANAAYVWKRIVTGFILCLDPRIGRLIAPACRQKQLPREPPDPFVRRQLRRNSGWRKRAFSHDVLPRPAPLRRCCECGSQSVPDRGDLRVAGPRSLGPAMGSWGNDEVE